MQELFTNEYSTSFHLIQENVQGGKIVAVKPLLLEPKPILPIKVNELLEPIYSSCSGKISGIRVGDVRESNNHGEYRVIEDLGTKMYCGELKRFFRIQYLNTGFISEVVDRELKSGLIKDPYQRSVYGVGFMGEINNKLPYFRDLYLTWRQMLNRCYNPNNKQYKDYGGRGVFVSNNWHCFSNYYWDVQELKGWDRKLENWKEFSLDKDILCVSNCYSLTTCIWASKNEQNLNTSVTKFFSAINPNGNKYYFVGCYYISEKYSLSKSAVSKCLLSKRKLHKGWTNFHPINPTKGYVLRWWKD